MLYKHYIDFQDFLNQIDHKPFAGAVSLTRKNMKFFNYLTFENAWKLAQSGDAKTAREVKKEFDAIKSNQIISLKETYQFNESGLFFDVPAYLDGEPEHWLETVNESDDSRGTKVIKIQINIATTVKMQQSEYYRRGANVLILIEALENAGYSVELDAIVVQKAGNFIKTVVIPLKSAGQAADFDKISFVLANSAFFRRLYFRCLELFPEDERKQLDITPSGNYGYCAELDESDKQGLYLGFITGRKTLPELLDSLKPYGDFELREK